MGTMMRHRLTPVKGSQGTSSLRKANLDHHAKRRVNHFLHIPPILLRGLPFLRYSPCDRLQRF